MKNMTCVEYCNHTYCKQCLIEYECRQLLKDNTLASAIIEKEEYDVAMKLKSILEIKMEGE